MRLCSYRRAGSDHRFVGLGVVALAIPLLLAACGSTPSASSSPTPTKSSSVYGTPSSSGAAASGVTIRTANVSGLGTVLVNAKGRTLYTLSSESGGQLTCTVANGCTQAWFEMDLPAAATAATAGTGAQTSMLGTETGATGTLVTYNGWPLYGFSGDSTTNQAKGEGLKSFGGTWYVLRSTGQLVKQATSASSPSSSSGGYGY